MSADIVYIYVGHICLWIFARSYQRFKTIHFSFVHKALITITKTTGELKTARGYMMPPQQHVYNGLARPDTSSYWHGTTWQTTGQTDNGNVTWWKYNGLRRLRRHKTRKATRPKGFSSQASKSIFGLVSPWPLTSWPPKLIFSRRCAVNH